MPFEETIYRGRANVFSGDLGDAVSPTVLALGDVLMFRVGPAAGPPLLSLSSAAPAAGGSTLTIDSAGVAPDPTTNPPTLGQPAQYTVTIQAEDLAALAGVGLAEAEVLWQPAGREARTADRGAFWVVDSLG